MSDLDEQQIRQRIETCNWYGLRAALVAVLDLPVAVVMQHSLTAMTATGYNVARDDVRRAIAIQLGITQEATP